MPCRRRAAYNTSAILSPIFRPDIITVPPESSEPSERYLKLLGETAQVRWSELAPLHLRGTLLHIAGDLDLVSVAEAVAGDDAQQVAAWAASGLLQRMPAETASAYESHDASLWAVVVAPWVLVQKRDDADRPASDAASNASADDTTRGNEQA